jgi:hypothetical protein
MRERLTPIPLDTISSDMTMNGKREGMTVPEHRISPFFIYSIATSEEDRSRRKAARVKAPVIAPRGEVFLVSLTIIPP